MKSFLTLAVIGLISLLVALCLDLRAQNTSATVIDFALIDTVNDNLLRARTERPYFMASNKASGTRNPVSVVTAWSTGASADSAWRYVHQEKRYWDVRLTTLTRGDSMATFTIREYNRNGFLRATYTQVVNYGTVKRSGADWYNGGAHAEADFGSTALGLNLAMCDYATLLQSVGWSWRLYLWDERLVELSVDGAIATYSEPSLVTQVIATFDTLARLSADTLWTDSVPGKNGFTNVFITATSTHADTVPVLGLFYKLKPDSISTWTVPIAYYGKRVAVILDSLAIPRGETRYVWPTTDPARWIKFGYTGKSPYGRVIVEKFVIEWRD